MTSALRSLADRWRGGVLPWTPRLALLAMVPTVFLPAAGSGSDAIRGTVSLRIWLLLIVAGIAAGRLVRRGDAHVTTATGLLERDGKTVLLLAALVTACGLTLSVGLPDLAARSVLVAVTGNDPTWQPSHPAVLILLVLLLTLITTRWRVQRQAIFGAMVLGYWLLLSAQAVALIAHTPGVLGALDPRSAANWVSAHPADALTALTSVVLVVVGLEGFAGAGRPPSSVRAGLAGLALAVTAVVVTELGEVAARAETPSMPTTLLQATLHDSPVLGTALALAAIVLGVRHLLEQTLRPLREAAQRGRLPRLGFERNMGLDGETHRLPMLGLPLLLLQLALWFGTRDPNALAAAVSLPLTLAWLAHGLQRSLRHRAAGVLGPRRATPTALAIAAMGGPFLAAALLDLRQGAWMALALPVAGVLVDRCWNRGRERLFAATRSTTLPLVSFCESIRSHPPRRIRHTAIVLTSRPESVPPVLLANLGFNQVLFDRVILLTVDTVDQPVVDDEVRLDLDPVGEGFFRARLRFGLEEETDVPNALERLVPEELSQPIRNAVYLIGHEVVVAAEGHGWGALQDRLFAALVRNAVPAHEHFHLPPNRRIEIGTRWSA